MKILQEKITLDEGIHQIGPFVLPDDEHQLHVGFTRWTKANGYWESEKTSLGVLSEITFDGGTNWQTLCEMFPNPGGPDDNETGLRSGGLCGFILNPIPLICSLCGNHYLPGDSRYDRALSHSTVALKQTKTMQDFTATTKKQAATAADFKMSILVVDNVDRDEEFLDRVFHTPVPVLPASRQVRLTLTVTGPQLITELIAESA